MGNCAEAAGHTSEAVNWVRDSPVFDIEESAAFSQHVKEELRGAANGLAWERLTDLQREAIDRMIQAISTVMCFGNAADPRAWADLVYHCEVIQNSVVASDGV